jgi:UPF0176 protein
MPSGPCRKIGTASGNGYGDRMLEPEDHVSQPICVAALYRFTSWDDPSAIQAELATLCAQWDIRGTLLLAHEGINGTVAGTDSASAALIAHLRQLHDCGELDVKYSRAASMPFWRMNVRLKSEIVTMGVADIDPRRSVGRYVEPEDWNALIADPDTIVIDTRNDYEVKVGTFRGAIDPQTVRFRDFPAWFRDHRAELLGDGPKRKVAMFCTGGIRCEKSTAFLMQEGVEDVFHLKGGILRYLEQVPPDQSLWEGECFVFDQRVTVGHGLVQGAYQLCFACRRPVSAEDMASPDYEEGVSCPACHGERTDAQRAAYRERQRQEERAAARGEAHIAANLDELRRSKAAPLAEDGPWDGSDAQSDRDQEASGHD